MKLTYDNKFKERTPQETISLIEKFFKEKQCEIQIKVLQQETSLTWSSHIWILYDGVKIATSNGKGTTKDFCLASAYAEAYERFCNKIFYLTNPFINKKIMDISYKNNGFYFDKNEKEISFEEAFDSSIGRYFIKHMSDSPEDLKELLSIIFDNKFIGVPYQNINNQNVKYIDPRVGVYINNSSGMAAGNSFFEAFNQAMCEVYEHFVNGRIFTNRCNAYFSLNLDIVKAKNLQEIVNSIQKKNFLYIIDLSYNYHVPVLMSIIVNKKTHAITMNLGASPIFEIALERVLTELYQGTKDFDEAKLIGQIPAYGYCDFRLLDSYYPGSTMVKPIFPEFIISNLQPIQSFNNKIFLSNEAYSNEDIFNYLKDINNKIGFDIYYYNCSLSKDMYAIRLFENNFPFLIEDFSFGNTIKNKTGCMLFILEIYNLINNYLLNGKFDIKDLSSLAIKNERLLSMNISHYINTLCGLRNWFIFQVGHSNTQNMLELTEKILYHTEDFLLKDNCPMPEYYAHVAEVIYEQLIIYIIISRYINSLNQYSTEEIISVLNFLNLKPEQIKDFQNKEYWLQKIIFTDLNKLKNGTYDDCLAMMANSAWSILTNEN